MSKLKAFELKVGRNLETDSPLVVGVDDKWNSRIMSCEEVYLKSEADKVIAELKATERRLRRALWLARAERYKMKEFIAREEGNLSNQMSWSRVLRERTYNQWVDQLLRIANLANKLQNKCRAKAEEYK